MFKDIRFRWALIASLLIASAYLIWPTYKVYSLSESEKSELGVTVLKELKDGAINLGLDLQGGSYLLLEIDNSPVITQRLQNKLSSLRKYFKTESINYKNLKIINNETISFELDRKFIESFTSLLENKDSNINPYYERFKSHEFEFNVNDNLFNLKYSKYGLIEIKKSSLNQAL